MPESMTTSLAAAREKLTSDDPHGKYQVTHRQHGFTFYGEWYGGEFIDTNNATWPIEDLTDFKHFAPPAPSVAESNRLSPQIVGPEPTPEEMDAIVKKMQDAMPSEARIVAERPTEPQTTSDWEFACNWYKPDEIERAIQQSGGKSFGAWDKIPADVTSREFAVWLCDQYRLAMNKGIQIGKSRAIPAAQEREGQLAAISKFADAAWDILNEERARLINDDIDGDGMDAIAKDRLEKLNAVADLRVETHAPRHLSPEIEQHALEILEGKLASLTTANERLQSERDRLKGLLSDCVDALRLVRKFGGKGEIKDESSRNGMSVSFFVDNAYEAATALKPQGETP